MGTLFVLHPSPFMVQALDALIHEIAPTLAYENLLHPDLLDEAKRDGINDSVRRKVREIITRVPEAPGTVILCSCSTLGGCAEQMQPFTTNRILRIDRPMAERAVSIGRRIGVAAALASTLGPTKELLNEVAAQVNKQIETVEFLCESAWRRKESGDEQGYIADIVASLRGAEGRVDVIVLAQGSMAQAASQLKHLGVPVLSSPRLAIETAARICS